MTMERADLAVGLSLEQAVPVSPTPAVQGQDSPEAGQGKARRRPPSEEASAELQEGKEGEDEDEDKGEDDKDQPGHRIDSLA